jgi:hypothetical protein
MKLTNAETFSGKYLMEGISDDAMKYAGIAMLTPHGLFAHVEAIIGKPDGKRYGLAVADDKRLLIAWGPKDKVEIGAYRIDGDLMQGLWIPPAATGIDTSACGEERSKRVNENVWEIEQAYDLEKNPYTGTITIEAASSGSPEVVKILWKLHDGEYRSFGLRGEGWMVSTFNFAPEFPHAVAAYETIRDGWKGEVIWKDAQAICRETLTRAAPEAASGRLSKRRTT